jgi:RNA polymerase sigma factor (sigma-70 family)
VDTDERLILRVSEGDWRALEELLGRYEAPLFGFFHRLGCRPSACEDLVQTVLIRVYEERSRYDPGRLFAPWIYGIARNVWRDHVRHEARHRANLGGESMEAVLATAPTPPESAQGVEERDLVQRALQRLPEGERLPLVLRHWLGLRYDEIAEMLGLPIGTVKWRVHKAHRQLAQWLPVRDRGEVKG